MRVAKNKRGKGKKVAAGLAAAVLVAGVAVHETFEPAELFQAKDSVPRQSAQEQNPSSGRRFLAELDSYERISLADAIRSWFIHLPVVIKGTILLPLWAVGAVPTALATALSPLWGALLAFLLQTIFLLTLFCGVYKTVFPERKVRELFRKKNLKKIFLGAFTVTVVNALLTQLWTNWPAWRAVLLSVVGLGVVSILYKRICGGFRAPEPEIVRSRLVFDT